MINWYLLIAAVFIWSIVYLLERDVNSTSEKLNIKEIVEYIAIVLGVTAFVMTAIAMFVSYFILKNDDMAHTCLVIIVCSVVLFLYIKDQQEKHQKEQARRAKLSAWAELNSWIYTPDGDWSKANYINLFKRFSQGSNQYVFDVLRGNWQQYPADAFNFHYEITSHSSSGSSTTHYYFGVVFIHIDKAFSNLIIRPRGFLSFGGIKFESIEFNRKFIVSSGDARFAYSFCHSKIMQYLLQQKNIDLELKENILAVFIDCNRLTVEDIEESLNGLVRIRKLMPNYLFRG